MALLGARPEGEAHGEDAGGAEAKTEGTARPEEERAWPGFGRATMPRLSFGASRDGREQVGVGREMASCNVEAGILFGKLDSLPLMGTDLRLGDELAVSYDKVVEHRKASDFEGQ